MPWRWSWAGGNVELLDLLLLTGFPAGFVGIMPAAWIVERHQNAYDKRCHGFQEALAMLQREPSYRSLSAPVFELRFKFGNPGF